MELRAPPQFGSTDDGLEYMSADGEITIAKYAGSSVAVVVAATINSQPVVAIEREAFANAALSSVTLPDSVTSVGESAFAYCYGLTNVAMGPRIKSIGDWAFESAALTRLVIPNSVNSLGVGAFYDCAKLTNVSIGNGVSAIGDSAFYDCASLTSVTIGSGVRSLGDGVFGFCDRLAKIYFSGDAPSDVGSDLFIGTYSTNYYLPGAAGWSSSFADRPTAPWFLPQPLILTQSGAFGVRSNHLGFTISWATNSAVVVESCANLSNAMWTPVSTNILVNGASAFWDPAAADASGRFYRLRSR